MSFRVVFHSVGAGHAIHAFMPNGKLVVIDLGCGGVFSPLTWLRDQGKTDIDLLIVTHPHGDHIDEIGLLDPLGFSVRQLSRPRWLTAEDVRAANQSKYAPHVTRYLKMNADYNGMPAPQDKTTDNPDAFGGVDVRVYSSPDCPRANINNHSLVVVFKYGHFTIVLPGDNEAPSWQSLLRDARFVQDVAASHLFLTSHHGRESGYCADVFANGRKPLLFVTSDGSVRDTDATPLYSQQAFGWEVNKRRGGTDHRKVVTTRMDGAIDVRFGLALADRRPFMDVSIS